jgi:hypothetical protein
MPVFVVVDALRRSIECVEDDFSGVAYRLVNEVARPSGLPNGGKMEIRDRRN